MPKYQTIELLSPAKNKAIAIDAINHGADAVYMGAAHHGARASAGNSINDISEVVDYAHRFGARVYVTVNTLVYDNEIADVESLIRDLYKIGVDALIVQDMGILRMDIPPIALHASTQCDIRTVEKARFMEAVGFSQIVLPREFSIDEIRTVAEAVKVPIEVFVHGALCVSYSGDCQASCLTNGRSANRGECAQMCRLSYDLTDGNGNIIERGKHLLSLRDLNRSADIEALIKAGVRSFKIEGRLKDADYVKNVTAFYRQTIDKVIDAHPDEYQRLSFGDVNLSFTPSLSRSFNRGFTSYFTHKVTPDTKMASLATPKFVGEPVAKVLACNGKKVVVATDVALNNGDGLGYFDADGRFAGFRANRIEGATIFAAENVEITKGTTLYRNSDKQWNDLMNSPTASRTIPVAVKIRRVADNRICIELTSECGKSLALCQDVQPIKANSPQEEARQRVLTKTGDTPYRVVDVVDSLGDLFVPASVMTDLRRRAFSLLDSQIRISHPRELRRDEDTTAEYIDRNLTYHDNVANRLAEAFYRQHGVETIEKAAEIASPEGDTVVMTTRYCIRRELGCCRRTVNASRLPADLYLQHGTTRFRLDFNCPHCQMHVVKTR